MAEIDLRAVYIEVIVHRKYYIKKIWKDFQRKNQVLDKARVSSRFSMLIYSTSSVRGQSFSLSF